MSLEDLPMQTLRGLTVAEIEAIDYRAKAAGLSRNQWMVRAVRHVLEQPVVRVPAKPINL